MNKVVGGAINLCSGTVMPRIGFGTFRLTEAESVYKALDCALETAYRLIDTAHLYQNETEIGNSLKNLLPKHNLKRDDIFLTTKLLCPAEHIRSGVHDSLSRLQTNYLDLVLLHYPMPNMPWHSMPCFASNTPQSPLNKGWRKDAWLELEKLAGEGKIRTIGVSNYEPQHLAEMPDYTTLPVAVNQIELHPQCTADHIVAKCKEMNIHIQAYTSLGRNHPDLMGAPLLNQVAHNHQATVAQVLLNWALQLGFSVLPKSANENRIKSNFEAIQISLTPKEIEEISSLNENKHYSKGRSWEVV